MILPWTRFWVPLGSEISCGLRGDGFFDDPNEKWECHNKSISHQLKDLLHEQCLFLAGEPGLGKSVALEQAFPEVDHASGGNEVTIWIRFRDIPDASAFTRRVFESHRWTSWQSSQRKLTLVLDGLDEGLIKIKDFVSFLTAELRSAPLERLSLVIACRTADWPVAAGTKLLNLWHNELSRSFWELCPLRRADVEMAAKQHSIESEAFLEEVHAKKVLTLAARPTTLFFLLRQFAANKQLEGTHRDIYERGILDLCREPDSERAEGQSLNTTTITAEEIRDAAGYLAAMLILCAHSALATGNPEQAASQRDLHIDTLLTFPSTEHLANRQSTISALETALFSSRGEHRLGFTHQSFAECLAARRVLHLPLIQLRKLFCGIDRKDEHVVPQLAETAAWLAGINDEFLQHVLNVDPEVLLRSDIARVQGNRKRQIVDAILERAKRHELFDDIGFRRFLCSLKHEQLARQLWVCIKDNTLNVVVRRLALEIAEECRITELESDLLTLLHEPGVEQQVRNGAARVLEKTLPDSRVYQLEPLAKGAMGPDLEDQMKGYALRRLVPKHWTVAQALEHMTPPQRSHFHGSYHVFLGHHAPDHLTAGDLPALLNWLVNVEHCFDTLNPFCELAHRALCLTLSHLEHAPIRDAAIALWLQKRRNFEHPRIGDGSEELETLWADVSIRRSFAFALLNDAKTTDEDVWRLLFDAFAVLEGTDLQWILEQLPRVSANRVPIWVKAVSCLARPEHTVKCWDFFLQRIDEIPELANCFSWLRIWHLDEPEARQAKARHLRNERQRKRIHRRLAAPHAQDLIAKDLALIANGEYWAWINLCQDLCLKEGQTHYPAVLQHDITESPAWETSDEAQRAIYRDAARGYLLHHSDGYKALHSRTNFSDPGYVAISLLRDRLSLDAALREAVSKKWINAIVGFFNNGEEHYQQMVELAYCLNPETTTEVLRSEAEDDYQRHGYIFAWRGFRRCWNSQLSAMLAEFAMSHWTNEKTLVSSLCFLFEVDPSAFHKWMHAVLPRNRGLAEETRVTVLAIAHAIAPSETWEYVWPTISEEQHLGSKVLLKVASELEFEGCKKNLDLDPQKLGLLAELLHTAFPPNPDAEHMDGFVTPRQAVADYRRKVADALTASPSTQAGDALLALAQKFPDRAIEFMWRHRDQLKTRRRTLWQPPSPADLSEIIARSEARLVSTELDLFEVVRESLMRFEDYYVRKELPAVRRLWENDIKVADKIKPKDEENLSDEIARWLRDDLGARGVIVGREVQIERQMKTDVLVKVRTLEKSETAHDTLTVVVEVKGCWNRGLKSDAEEQLVQKYLLPHGWTYGLYIVGWFVCDAWHDVRKYLVSDTVENAREEVRQLAEEVMKRHPELTVAGLLLDCRYR